MASSPGMQLRRLLAEEGKCIAVPGAFNGMVARLIKLAGFEAVYVSGGALSAAQGVPDTGVVGMEAFCKTIREVTAVSGLPCIADADAGFGDASFVARTVHEYNVNGAAGLHIEDQEFPKRCGHLDGKSLVPTDDMCHKLSVAVTARDNAAHAGMVICARTDARQVEGFESAVERARRYVEAGADMIFPEGLHTEEEFKQFAEAMRKVSGEGGGKASCGGPFLLANMTEFGKTPMIPLSFFERCGYHAVIYPVSTLRAAMKPVQEMLECLKANGTVEPVMSKMLTRKELYETLQYTPGQEWHYPSINKSPSSSS